MALAKVYEEFIQDAIIGNLSSETIRTYREVIGAVVRAFSDADIQDITAQDMRGYLAGLWDRQRRGELSAHTVGKHDRHLRAFWTFAVNNGAIERSPMDGIRRPKLPPIEADGISPNDFARLLKQCDLMTDDIEAARNKALLLFLAETGARRGGAVGLTTDKLDIQNRRAHVTEKGNKSRWVFFSHYTARALSVWLSLRESDSHYVFTSMRSGQGLKGSGINQIIKRLKKASGVRGNVSPKRFRNGFARAFVTAGGDISVLAKLMGHSNVNVTATYYAVFSPDELAALHAERGILDAMLGDG